MADDLMNLCANLDKAADAVAKQLEQQRPIDTAKEAEAEAAKLKQVEASLAGAERTLEMAVAKQPELAHSPAVQNSSRKLQEARRSASQSLTLSSAIAESYRNVKNRSLQRIQLCWVIDGTKSMEPHIEMVKTYITEVTQQVAKLSSMIVSVGYVVYRDHNCGDALYSVHDFSDVSHFLARLRQEATMGGSDICEECFGGLRAACTRLSWSAEAIIHPMVWVGDTPQHGFLRGYPESPKYDHWPKGHPDAPTPIEIVDMMAQRAIHLIFLRITKHTDHMIEELNKHRGEAIEVHDMELIKDDPSKWLTHFLRDSSLNSSTNSSSRNGGGGGNGGGGLATGAAPPRRLQVPKLRQAKKISLSFDAGSMQRLSGNPVVAVSLSNIANDDLIDLLGDFSKPAPNIQRQNGMKEVLVAAGYFGSGGIRYAHAALLKATNRFVAKAYQRTQDNTLDMCVMEMRQTLLADVLATTFRAKIPNIEFSYVATFCMEMTADTPDPPFSRYYAFEEFVEGEFCKFNSNNGGVDDTHPLAQCFTHYTFHRSRGKYMICDLQGWKASDRSYKLTDPAVLTRNPADFPVPTNMGLDGMNAFLRAHKCNEYCKVLGLTDYETAK